MARRSNGEGSFYQQKDKSWVYQVTYGLISYILYRYASGTPMISVMMVTAMDTLKEFHRVIR